jgi:hypothetical protein
MTSIADGLFADTALTSITIPGNITSIGLNAFRWCWSLASVIISPGVISIGEAAFESCTNLTSVTLPNTLTTIGPEAFRQNRDLPRITIPTSVVTIGALAFAECSALTIHSDLEGPQYMPSGWHANWNPDPRPVVWNTPPPLISVTLVVDGIPSIIIIPVGVQTFGVSIPTQTAPQGMRFRGWTLVPNGEPIWADGSRLLIDRDMRLYAVFGEIKPPPPF